MNLRSAMAIWMVLWVAVPKVGADAQTEGAATTVSFAAVGDVMLGSTWPDSLLPPDDAMGLLREVTPVLSAADIAFGNLEGPLVDSGEPTVCRPEETPCYRFRAPVRYGERLKDAGFDVMSLANNHLYDFGPGGIESTRRILDELGIAHSGAAGDVAHLFANGKRIAVVAFATDDYSENLNDIDRAREIVLELAGENDLVVVSFHGGAEGPDQQAVPHRPEWSSGARLGDLRDFAHAVVDAGADLVLGHGPHVLRGMEIYRGRLIAYSLGNFATYGRFHLKGPLGISLILQARLAEDGRFVRGKIVSVRQSKPGGPRLDRSRTAVRLIRNLSKKDFRTSAVKVFRNGTILPPDVSR